MARFAALEEITLLKVVEPDQFQDSLYIDDYARSGVTACQMAGIVKGYEDGFFYPPEHHEPPGGRQPWSTGSWHAADREIPKGSETVEASLHRRGLRQPLRQLHRHPVRGPGPRIRGRPRELL